jgi:hypothetical protein
MEERNRIPRWLGWIIYGIAISLDVLGIIPVVHFAVPILSLAIIGGIFAIRGAGYFKKPKRLIIAASTAIVGFIPLIGSLPIEQIANAFLNIRDVRKEDKKYNAKIRDMVAEEPGYSETT